MYTEGRNRFLPTLKQREGGALSARPSATPPGISLRAKPSSGATGRARLDGSHRGGAGPGLRDETGSVWPLAIRSEFYHVKLLMFQPDHFRPPPSLSVRCLCLCSLPIASRLALCRPLPLEVPFNGKLHVVSILLLKPQSLFLATEGMCQWE